jgi:predicted nucleic acid-binding protein
MKNYLNESLVSIDANVVVWSLVPSPLSDKAQELLGAIQAHQLTLVAPALLAFEVTSVLTRLVYLKALTRDEGEEAFAIFQRIPMRLSSRKGIIPLAWRLAEQFNRPRAYDTSYLAVAQLYGCELWTADEKLYNVVGGQLPWVKWLGDYNSIS